MSVTHGILGPLEGGTMRVVFLYVGQGEATLVFMPAVGGGHLSMLIDCNRSASLKGTDVAKLLVDALPHEHEGKPVLDVFVNTHPHNDHLCGLDDVREAVHVREVWHSGHRPSNHHEGPYSQLKTLLRDVEKRGGPVKVLKGSRTAVPFGLGEVLVLSPAEHINDEIGELSPEERDQRIHDQCAVLRIAYGPDGAKTAVMITGDSDKTAWKRITPYHGRPEENRLKSHVLSASHHGSYTFFKHREDDPEPYEEHLKAIAPERIIVSAPDQQDSKHDHPNADSMRRYRGAVGREYVHHMGSRAWAFMVEAYGSGGYSVTDDRGDLASSFPVGDSKSDCDDGPSGVSIVEQSRPMGAR